ncbi:hypothetical protein HRbin22_00787 [Candidatus Thermoflexus japonica]|uniref:Uncharacterized protein n=1 Tax=Candidatus Thermoflexus japonica TaxID=2035417 RepID=A0A2H5Y531_9CHLR|nr:hypothetical protein HRbin22_00787 [Candidatus Thermoflexus japonica]
MSTSRFTFHASRFTLHALLLAALLLLLASVALAQSDGGYDLSWWTVDGGGYTWSEGGGYALGGTIGQPDAGAALTGGNYTLVGGFWGGAVVQYRVYLPLVLRNY